LRRAAGAGLPFASFFVCFVFFAAFLAAFLAAFFACFWILTADFGFCFGFMVGVLPRCGRPVRRGGRLESLGNRLRGSACPGVGRVGTG